MIRSVYHPTPGVKKNLNKNDHAAAVKEAIAFVMDLPFSEWGKEHKVRDGLEIQANGFSCTPRLVNGTWQFKYTTDMVIDAYEKHGIN